MAVEGRTHRPVIDHEKCDMCSVCCYTCPAAVMPELRREEDSLRGKIYRDMGAEIRLKEGFGQAVPPPCQQSCPLGQACLSLARGQPRRAYPKIVSCKEASRGNSSRVG